jgi:ABC-type Fe3+/spermidine/putrescine transport system ATPase subunit
MVNSESTMLQIQNLAVNLGDFTLHEVSLSIPEGDYFCLIGPTGSGKTMLLECVAGLHKPSAGRMHINGRDVTTLPPEARRVGYVPQDYALFPHMDVKANIAYGLVERKVTKNEIARRVESVAELLHIPHLLDRRITNLSGGERQRVALARALVLDCRVLLLDEPLTALDEVTKQELTPYLVDLHQRLGLTVLHVTHDFNEAFSLASHVGVIHGGHLLQFGTVEEVFGRPASRTVARFVGVANIWPASREISYKCPLVRRLLTSLAPSCQGDCSVCIRPDQIHLSRQSNTGDEFSAEGVVHQVRWLGSVYQLVMDIGTPLVVSLGRREYERLGCRVGDSLYVNIDPSGVHILN